MKTARNILIIFVIIAALIVAKFIFFPGEDPQQGKDKKGGGKGKGGATAVDVHVVKPQPLDNRIFISGTVMANEEVRLVPETAGKVTGIYFKEGSKISKGQLLVTLNDAELKAQLKKMEVQEKLLVAQEQRLAKLAEIKGISQEEYETTLTQLNAIKADMEITRAQMAKMQIHAPFSGQIGIKNISEGSYVSPTTFIAILEQSDPVKVDFYVPEKYAHLVKTGDTMSFSMEGRTEKTLAKVSAIDPMIDQATRTLRVRATAPNKNNTIIPGAFARINFLLDHNEEALLVPTESVIPVLKGKKVFVVKNGKAEEVMVETGLRSDRSIQIISGLQAGDTVITKGIMAIKAGAPVKILNMKKGGNKK